MPTPITNKHEMYLRLNAGLLGHTLPSAETPRDLYPLLDRYPTIKFAIRSKSENSGTVFNLVPSKLMEQVMLRKPGTWNVTPMMQDEYRVAYCHLLDTAGGWFLHYSDDPKPCKLMPSKDGCAQKWKEGIAARVYLRGIMDDIAWKTLTDLVEQYPEHCIEFSVMSGSEFAFGPTNTVFWEVRSALVGEYEKGTWR